MPPRLENRFRMLIEISLGKGVANLKGFRQKLDATSNSLRGVSRFLKEYGVELGVGRTRLKTYVSSLEKVRGAHTKLKEAQRALIIEQKKEALAVAEAKAEYTKAQTALDKLTAKENKSAVAKKRFSAATDKARVAQRQLVSAEKAVGVQSSKAKDRLDKVARSFRALAKEVNIGKERMVQLDRRTMKSTVQWKKLGNRIVLAKAQMKQFTDSSRRAERQSQKTAKSQDRVQSEFNQTTAAVKRAGHEFQIWTDQRLTSSAIPALRRRLGALRNQLLVLAFATRGLIGIFDKAFTSSLRLESALKGLGSVAINTGAGMKAAQQAALALASKGLIDVADAAAGLKNLLTAGFGLPEAIQLMDTLTNSAAFNRQGTLKLGEAVVGATQGIKNQNSIMVDNAGITKNLSIMYKEYAARIGTTMGRLTEVQKRQAIFSGILKEGAIFAGDAEKVLATLAGRLSVLSTKIFMASASLGNVLKPGLEAIVNLFAEGTAATGRFLEKMEKSNSIIRESRKIGQGFASILKDLVGVVGIFTGAIVKVISVTGGLAAWLGIALKLSIALRIKRKLVSLFTVSVEKNSRAIKILTATEHHHGKTLREGTLTQKVAILRMGNLTAQYRVTRMALVRLQARQVAVTKQTTGLTLAWNRLTVVVGKSLIPLKAAGVALKRVGGAAVIARVALKGFLASLGPILIAFLAFEGVLWIIDRVFGAAKRAREMTKANAEMTTQLGAYGNKLREVQKISAGAEGAAALIGLDLLGGDVGQLRSNLARLSAFHSKIEKLTNRFNQAKGAKSREAIREQIELEKKGFDAIIEATREAHVRIEQAIADHHQARADIKALFTNIEERFEDSAFDKALKKNLESHDALTLQYRAFRERRRRTAIDANGELAEDERLLNLIMGLLFKERTEIHLSEVRRVAQMELRIARRARSEQIRLISAQEQLGISKGRLVSLEAEADARHELAKVQTESINLLGLEKTSFGVLNREREKTAALESLFRVQRDTEIADHIRATEVLEAKINVEKAHLKGLGLENQVNAEAIKTSETKIKLYIAEMEVLVLKGVISKQVFEDELERLKEIQEFKERAARLSDLSFAGRQIDAAVAFADKMAQIDEQKIANKAQHIRDLDKLLEDERISEADHAALSLKSRELEDKRSELLREKERLALRSQVLDLLASYGAKYLAATGPWGLVAAIALLGARALLRIGELREARDIDRRIADLDRGFKEAVTEATDTETARQDREAARKLGGTIKAQNLDVTISPTIVISGEQIFIGQGSVTEFGSELQALLLNSMQQSIDTGEIDLSTIANMQG